MRVVEALAVVAAWVAAIVLGVRWVVVTVKRRRARRRAEELAQHWQRCDRVVGGVYMVWLSKPGNDDDVIGTVSTSAPDFQEQRRGLLVAANDRITEYESDVVA